MTTQWLDNNNVSYTVSADGLILIDGNIDIKAGDDVTLDNVIEVSGSVDVSENATLNAPALAEVSGSVDVSENAALNAPALVKSGPVYVRANATLNAPALVKSGPVYVSENATLNAPALAEVSGSVDVSENATLNAPALVTIGHVRCEIELFGYQIKVFDGIGCVVLSEKQRDGITIRYCRKAAFKDGRLVGDKFFVVSQVEHNSHGSSLEEAMADLLYKTADRDVSKYQNMPLDTIKSPHEWSTVYRIVTGACQYGTQQFMQQKGALKELYTLAEIIEETRGAYASDHFREVVGVMS